MCALVYIVRSSHTHTHTHTPFNREERVFEPFWGKQATINTFAIIELWLTIDGIERYESTMVSNDERREKRMRKMKWPMNNNNRFRIDANSKQSLFYLIRWQLNVDIEHGPIACHQ